jgi:hypothetical protein
MNTARSILRRVYLTACRIILAPFLPATSGGRHRKTVS